MDFTLAANIVVLLTRKIELVQLACIILKPGDYVNQAAMRCGSADVIS